MVSGLLALTGITHAATQDSSIYVVCNGNFIDQSVRVIDTDKDTVTHYLEKFPDYSWPSGIAISPDDKTLYVTDAGARGAWHFALDNHFQRKGLIGGHSFISPAGIALTFDGRKAYVANSSGETVVSVNLVSKQITSLFGVGSIPVDIAMSQNRKYAYVVNRGEPGKSSSVRIINTATDQLLDKHLTFGRSAVRIILSPSGKLAYVLERANTTTECFSSTVYVVDTQSLKVINRLDTSQDFACDLSVDLAITHDESALYVANQNTDTVSVFNLKNGNKRSFISGHFNQPSGIATLPGSDKVYVADRNSIKIISTKTNAVIGDVSGATGGERCFFSSVQNDGMCRNL